MSITTQESVLVSARLSKSLRAEIKAKGFTIGELIRIGYQAAGNFLYLRDRVSTLEEGNIRLQTKLTAISERLYKLENKGQKSLI